MKFPYKKFRSRKTIDVDKINSVHRFALQSERILNNGAFKWIEEGSEDGSTSDLNKRIFQNFSIIPKNLVDTSRLSLGNNFFGHSMKNPILGAPMGHLGAFHPLGELGVFEGFRRSSGYTFWSCLSRFHFRKIEQVTSDNYPFGIQIYPYGDIDWIITLIYDAMSYGATTVCLTIDSPVRAISHSKLPDFDLREFGVGNTWVNADVDLRSKFTFDSLSKVIDRSPLPIIVKGQLDLSDADQILNLGAKGIWISNHGGRALNSNMHPIMSLHKVRTLIDQRFDLEYKPVLIADGGIKTGTDVLKMLGLGADFVAIGRPLLHGLIVGGIQGVCKVLNLLDHDVITSLKLAGGVGYEVVSNRYFHDWEE